MNQVKSPLQHIVDRSLPNAFDEGVLARRDGRPAGACGYPQHSERRAFWLLGHAAQPGSRYNVAGQRKRIAADAHPFAPGIVEVHRAPPSRLTRVLAWLYVAVVAAALGAYVIITLARSAS